MTIYEEREKYEEYKRIIKEIYNKIDLFMMETGVYNDICIIVPCGYYDIIRKYNDRLTFTRLPLINRLCAYFEGCKLIPADSDKIYIGLDMD